MYRRIFHTQTFYDIRNILLHNGCAERSNNRGRGQILDKSTDIAVHWTKFITPFGQTMNLIHNDRVHLVLLNCLPQMRIIQPFRCNKERLEFTMLQSFNNIGILRIAAVQAARSDFAVLATLH